MNEKILIVGDIHGYFGDLNSLITKKNPDIIIACGDFGFWPKNFMGYKERGWLTDFVKPGSTKIYWCDGNHEFHPELERRTKKHGRVPFEVKENVFYCPRGSSIVLPSGETVGFLGGADSIDKHVRTIGYDWFPQELINSEDKDVCMKWDKCDVLITHTNSSFINQQLADRSSFGRGEKIHDVSNHIIADVLFHFKPKYHFFGHWHIPLTGFIEETQTRWCALNQLKATNWWIDFEKFKNQYENIRFAKV